MQHTAIDGTAKKRRAALWALCTALAVLCAVAVTYYWRVFYAYTAVPAVPLALCAAALAPVSYTHLTLPTILRV